MNPKKVPGRIPRRCERRSVTTARATRLVSLALVILCTAGCADGKLSDWRQKKKTSDQPRPVARQQAASASAATVARTSPDAAESGPVDTLTVNEDVITVDDVLGPIRSDLSSRANTMAMADYRDHLVQTLQTRIRHLVQEALLHQEASRRLTEQEQTMIDEFTDQRVREIVQAEYGGRQVRWERAMAEQGFTPEQARDQVRRQVVVRAWLERTVIPRVTEPTRRELLNYYEQKKVELTTTERRELLLIEVPKSDDPGAARRTIDQAYAELQRGTPFADVARQHSQGVHAGDGGSWGLITPGSLRGRWAQADRILAQLSPGQTSGVVDGEEHFFIIGLGRFEPSQTPNFAEMQVRLTEAYREHQFGILVDELVARLQEDAVIRPEDPGRFLLSVANASPRPGQSHGG